MPCQKNGYVRGLRVAGDIIEGLLRNPVGTGCGLERRRLEHAASSEGDANALRLAEVVAQLLERFDQTQILENRRMELSRELPGFIRNSKRAFLCATKM